MLIFGGLTLVGNSNKVRKNYSRYFLPNLITSAYTMNVCAEKKLWIATVSIMFTNENEVGVNYPHDDALVITLSVGPSEVNKILIDTGSSADIIFKDTLESMKIENLRLDLVDIGLYRFIESYTLPIGTVQLPVTIGSQPYQKTNMVTF